VPVEDDVDHVLLDYAQVGLPQDWRGRAEQDVRDIGGNHRATPAVGQSCAYRVVQNMLGLLVIADVRAVECLDHLTIHTAGPDLLIAPELLSFLRGTKGRDELASLLAKL